PQLAPRALDEDPAAVREDERSENGSDPAGSGEGGRRIAEQHLDVLGPEDHGKRQEQREPEPVPEHVHAVPSVGVVVMTTVVLAATPAMVTMSCVFKRLYGHRLLRVLRVAGLGRSRVVVVVVIMTVVAMFVHA